MSKSCIPLLDLSLPGQNCIKPDVLLAASSMTNQLKQYISDSKNQVSVHSLGIGCGTIQKCHFHHICLHFLIAMSDKLLQCCPFSYAAACLNPLVQLISAKCFTASLCDAAERACKLFLCACIMKLKSEFDSFHFQTQ